MKILLAELYGKVENHMEDELTGNVFGTLRYASFNTIFKPLLKSCVRPTKIVAVIDKINCDFWGDNIKFWSYDKQGEIDVLMTFDEVILGVEVKYLSGLSGANQLEREAEIISHKAGGREKILLLLAPMNTCLDIVTANYQKKFLNTWDVQLGYLAWENFLDALKILQNDSALNFYENLIVDDLIELLTQKGFAPFRSFDLGDVEDIFVEGGYFDFEREFAMATTNANIANAAAVIRKTHENVQKFLEYCKNLAKSSAVNYELLTEDFLRFNSDRNFYGFMYGSFILLFKHKDSATNIVYGIEVNLGESHVKAIKYFYGDTFDYQKRISPSAISKYEEPLREFDGVIDGDYMKIDVPPDKQEQYQKLYKLIYKAISLNEITAENVQDKVFGAIDLLRNIN